METTQTKKCSECQMDISVLAKKCPHCQSKVKQPTSRVVKVLSILLGVFFIIGFFSIALTDQSSYTTSQTQPTKQPDYAGSARAYAEPYISRLLKSPSTADFCRGTATDLGENKWKVSSCVDSQNSYGASLRNNWEVVMVYTGGDADDIGSWRAEKITFDGKVIK